MPTWILQTIDNNTVQKDMPYFIVYDLVKTPFKLEHG